MKPRASTSLPAMAFLCAACLALCLILPAAALPGPAAQEGKGDAPGKDAPEKPAKKSDKKSEKKPADKKPAEKKKTVEGKADSKEKAEGGAGKDAGSTSTPASAPSPDVAYVKENLKSFIHGTVVFQSDDTVTIDYDFQQKKEEHQNDFRPPISTKTMEVFRWSLYQEEHVIGGDVGLRVSDKGAAFLNVWFTDEVEATAEYLQGINFSKRQWLAVAFQAKNGKAIGNNYGTQCASFSGGGLQGGVPASPEAVSFNLRPKIGLKLKGGTYEALRDGKPRGSAKYSPKSFSSGRIGFIWGGSVAGTMISLSIKGKLDFAATAQEMRKRAGAK